MKRGDRRNTTLRVNGTTDELSIDSRLTLGLPPGCSACVTCSTRTAARISTAAASAPARLVSSFRLLEWDLTALLDALEANRTEGHRDVPEQVSLRTVKNCQRCGPDRGRNTVATASHRGASSAG
jgi:hypothetical protein